MTGFIALLILVGAVAFGISVAQAGKTNGAWTSAARALHLKFAPPSLMEHRFLSGTLDGHRVDVHTLSRGSGKDRSVFTRFRLIFARRIGLGLGLRQAGHVPGVSRILSGRDMEVGEVAFDRLVRVKGSDRQAVLEFLTRERRDRIRHFLSTHRGAIIEDGEVSWNRRGVVRESRQIVSTVREMIELASCLAGDQDNGEDFEFMPSDGGFKVVEPEPEEAEWIEVSNDIEELEEIVVEQEEPIDPPAAQVVETPELTPEMVCATLFCDEVTSFKAARLFDEQFAGQRVTWSGVLRAVDSYSYDFVLGQGPGTKATLVLRETDGSGRDQVVATVALPDAAREELRQRVDQTLTFEGTLVKVDALLRNLFVADARVE